jgi:hypothetical protein
LRAQGVGLIAGAFVLALATILLYFLFTPRAGYRRGKAHRRNRQVSRQRQSAVLAAVESAAAAPMTVPVPASTKETTEGLPLPA